MNPPAASGLSRTTFSLTAVALAFVTTLCFPGVAAAQSTDALPATVTIEQVMDLLAQRSPRTIADRATVGIVAADRITAQTLPNPSVSYGGVHLVSGLSTGAVTQHQMVLEQPLLVFGQRQARTDAADLNTRAEQARVGDTLAQRRLAVRQAFATLLSRQQQLQVMQDSVADLERVQQVVRGRAEAGERSRYDVMRIETEMETLRVQVMNAEADVDDASGQLASLLGFAGWSPRATGTLSPGNVPTDVSVLWDTAQARRPSIVAARQQQSAARGGLFLAQRERLPIPAVSGGAQITSDVTGTSAFFGFSMPLPLFDHNQGAIAKAQAQIDADQRAIDAELAEARADVERAATVLVKRREALTRLESQVVQRTPMLRQMAEDAYREGSADILELLDAMRSLKDIQIAHVQQLESTKLAEEAVISAAGLDAPAATN
jgi:cobalt-zinc-cadmium efflux system outer membrane protein